MKTTIYCIIAWSVMFWACAGTQKTTQLKTDIEAASQQGDHQKALQASEDLIALQKKKNQEVDPKVYSMAGIAAWELNQHPKALDYLENAKRGGILEQKVYYILAQGYKEINNLSKEITNLELYISKFPEGDYLKQVRQQLFIAYVESENWEQANELWAKLDPEIKKDIRVAEKIFAVNKKLEKKNDLESLAKQILKAEKENVAALEYLAEKYYYLAENSYQTETKAYEKNKSKVQYDKMMKAFKILNENFKISRDYFLKLYKIKPDERYATFLGNIYTRFDNKEKADYYYKEAKKLKK